MHRFNVIPRQLWEKLFLSLERIHLLLESPMIQMQSTSQTLNNYYVYTCFGSTWSLPLWSTYTEIYRNKRNHKLATRSALRGTSENDWKVSKILPFPFVSWSELVPDILALNKSHPFGLCLLWNLKKEMILKFGPPFWMTL